MKSITHFLALAAISIFFTSCEQNGTVIKGTATGAEKLSFIKMGGQQPDTIASLDMGNSEEFSQELQIDTMTMLFVYATENFAVPLFVQPGENVDLNINVDEDPPGYEVSGSPESERVRKITRILEDAMEKVDSLNEEVQKAEGTEGFAQKRRELDAVFQEVVKNTGKRYKEMIDEEPGSIANIFIFSQAIGQVPMISIQEDFEYVEKVAEGIREKYPDAKITQTFVSRIEELKKQMAAEEQMKNVQKGVGPGTEAPEISLKNPEGQVMSLSDLRGKIVLVDFWAAWCKPCRMENPNLVRTYNKYKDQGFEVFSVSLDGLPQQQNPKEQWVQAIEMDQLTWDYHVSDLKGWQTSVVPKYGFQGIPYTVLVDRDGKIIETNLRGPQLEAKLKEVFGES